MDNRLSSEDIENAIDELNKFIGVKEPISGKEINALVWDGKIKESIKHIAQQLGLPIDINIIKVPENITSQSGNNKFHSTQIVKSENGASNNGITAQVNIPSNLPIYGTLRLNNFPINVWVSENCMKDPRGFLVIMSHELSHVLLNSLNYGKKDNEFYTDLTAMMLGFNEIFKYGRKNTTSTTDFGLLSSTTHYSTTIYGYLSSDQFYLAYERINKILDVNRKKTKFILDQLRKFKKLVSMYNKTFLRTKKYIEFLSRNSIKKFLGNDCDKVVAIFQPNYVGELDLDAKRYNQKYREFETFMKNLSHYTEPKMGNALAELKDLAEDSKAKLKLLSKDLDTVGKYISLTYKLKLFILNV